MSLLGATGLVAGREIRESLIRKSFWAILGVLFVGSVAAMVVPELLRDDGTTHDVVVVGDAPDVTAALRSTARATDIDVDIRHVDEAATASRRVKDGRADIAIVPGDPAGAGATPRIIVRSGENEVMVGVARQSLGSVALNSGLADAGLTADQIRSISSAPAPRVTEVDEASSGRRAAAFVVSLVLYLLLLTLMVQVANGVAVEKANRISEVLLAVVRPGALLFGKVLGVTVIGLATVAAAALPVLVKFVGGGDLPQGIGGAIAGSIVWLLLGLVLYLTISGALGALVERQEQAGAVVAPLMFVLIGTFLVAQSAPDTTLGTVLAYVPLTSPLIVPTRIAIGVASTAELVISLALLVVSILVAGRFGAAIYARAIVRTDRRLTLREAWSRS